MKAPADFPEEFFKELPEQTQKLVTYTWTRLDEDIQEAVRMIIKETPLEDRVLEFMVAMMEACKVMGERTDPKRLN
jgi:hypothetical protein